MNKKHFGEMLGSVDQAVEIARGGRKPARATTLSEADARAIRRSLGRPEPGEEAGSVESRCGAVV
jgi:hypothetical protein